MPCVLLERRERDVLDSTTKQQFQGQDVTKSLWEAKPSVKAVTQGKSLKAGGSHEFSSLQIMI